MASTLRALPLPFCISLFLILWMRHGIVMRAEALLVIAANMFSDPKPLAMTKLAADVMTNGFPFVLAKRRQRLAEILAPVAAYRMRHAPHFSDGSRCQRAQAAMGRHLQMNDAMM